MNKNKNKNLNKNENKYKNWKFEAIELLEFLSLTRFIFISLIFPCCLPLVWSDEMIPAMLASDSPKGKIIKRSGNNIEEKSRNKKVKKKKVVKEKEKKKKEWEQRNEKGVEEEETKKE